MNPNPLTIEVSGLDASERTLQAIRSALADRRPLHAEMAGNSLEMTRQYLRGLNRHNTAARLGASPTGHHERSAMALQAEADDEAAILRIPRNTGLGRAFGEITIRPLGGRKFLTIPATAETYGRQAGEWPEDTFEFAVIMTHRGPTPVLKWAEAGGPHAKGDVAFWLRRSVTQRQDRTLLPSDDSYREISRRTIIAHLQNIIAAERSGGGPYGGTSTGMPTT